MREPRSGIGNAGKQRVARIARAHAAGRLGSVQRERIEADVVAPECFLEALAQAFGLGRKGGRALVQA